MKKTTKLTPIIPLGATLAGLALTLAAPAGAVDLLERYPTTLTGALLGAANARPWDFTTRDIFHLSRFRFAVGDNLKVETGPATLGIGHASVGAVWAIIIPAEDGKLTRPGAGGEEQIAHIWLRFHPKEINRLFPPGTVSLTDATGLFGQMRAIAGFKMRASYHAGGLAMIPAPKDMTVDVDTKAGPRRFFGVDTEAGSAEYVSAFERQRVPAGAPRIVATSPANGATGVDPGLTEITVTFDQDMAEGFSWTGGGPQYPKTPQGQRPHWRDRRTCVLPVELEAGHDYRVGINSPSYHNFRSSAGQPVEPSAINFSTK